MSAQMQKPIRCTPGSRSRWPGRHSTRRLTWSHKFVHNLSEPARTCRQLYASRRRVWEPLSMSSMAVP
eukprot:7381327-Prymnesium_polylepis.1